MKKMFVILSCSFSVFWGCATTPKHDHVSGAVVALDSPTEGHACLPSAEVTVGEQVALFKAVCRTNPPRGRLNPTSQITCSKEPKGFAEVTENSDTHFIKVKVTEGSLEEGLVVEKIKKQ